ncbi:hypothetical protein EB001_10415 [bacterium]|jgi:hypothetical protein|nr:hypothetical protein [bacterium]
MSATMISMDNFVFVDQLLPDQLLEGDLIEFSDEYATEIGRVINIESTYENNQYTYVIQGRNDFDEILEIVVNDSEYLKLFIVRDE